MHYFGGKQRIAKPIAAILNKNITSDYYEPFVGSANVTQFITAKTRFASDKHPELIAMWQELQNGWIPPDEVSEVEYGHVRQSLQPKHLAGFIGFGCSYSGKWFGGYCRDSTGRNYAKNAKNSVLKKLNNLKDVKFDCCNFSDVSPANSVVYCDPPYQNTTEYSVVFSSDEFWAWARQQSENNLVFISEYSAPNDFIAVWEKVVKLDIRSKGGVKDQRIEKLYVHKEHANLVLT
jgi:DNA adenine methylase